MKNQFKNFHIMCVCVCVSIISPIQINGNKCNRKTSPRIHVYFILKYIHTLTLTHIPLTLLQTHIHYKNSRFFLQNTRNTQKLLQHFFLFSFKRHSMLNLLVGFFFSIFFNIFPDAL